MATSTGHLTAIDGTPTELLVGGAWTAAASGAKLEVEDPSTAEPLAEVADAGADDALEALDAAHQRFGEFSRTAPEARAQILRERTR